MMPFNLCHDLFFDLLFFCSKSEKTISKETTSRCSPDVSSSVLMSYCFCFVRRCWVFFFNTEPNKMPSHANMRYSSREAKRSSRPCFANVFGQTTSCRDSATQLMLFKSRGVFNASLPGSQAQFHFTGVLYTSM